MVVYSGFEDYLEIDGVNVSPYIRDVELEESMETAETTAGSGVTNRTRNTGLKDHTLSFSIVYEIEDIAIWRPLMRAGEHTVVWGPQGNASGKPKHEQKFIFESAPLSGNYEQSEARTIPVSAVSSEAPITDYWAGGTFA